MIKLLSALGLLGLLLCGCSKNSTEVVSSPSPNAANSLGCDFKIPNAVRNGQLTQATINEAVGAGPVPIRADLRVVYESAMKYKKDVAAAQAAPVSKRTAILQAASKDLSNPQYRDATKRLRTYFMAHCTGLRQRTTPSASP